MTRIPNKDHGKKPKALKPPKTDVFAATDPLAPLVPPEVVAKAPKAKPEEKKGQREPHHDPADKPKTKPRDELKPPERRARPAVGARGGAPNNPLIAKPHKVDILGDIHDAVDVGLGTAIETAKVIPNVMFTPIHPGETHTQAEESHLGIHSKTYGEAMGQKQDKPYKVPHDYVNLVGPGRTPLSPAQQAAKIKKQGGFTPDQAKHFNEVAPDHPVYASILLAVADASKGHTDGLGEAIASMSPEERTHVLAGVQNIHNLHLFNAKQRAEIDAGRKYPGLPKNASDDQILEYLYHNKYHKGGSSWTDIPGNVIGDAKDIVEGLAQIPMATPAIIGGANEALHGNLDPAKELVRTVVEPYVEIARDPRKAFTEHPLSSTLAVVPGVGAVVGKVARAAGMEAAATNVARTVKLPKYETELNVGLHSHKPGRAILENVRDAAVPKVDALLQRVAGADVSPMQNRVYKKAAKKAEIQVGNEGTHAIVGLIKAAHRSTEGISKSRQVELFRTAAQGVTNEELKRYYLAQADEIEKAIKSAEIKPVSEHGATAESPSAYREVENADGSTSTVIIKRSPKLLAHEAQQKADVARANAEIAKKPAAKKKYEKQAAKYQAEADHFRAQTVESVPTPGEIPGLERAQRQTEAHANLAAKGDPELNITPKEQEFLKAHANVVRYREHLLMNKVPGDVLSEQSALFRSYQPAILAQATAGSEIAIAILKARDTIKPIQERLDKGKTLSDVDSLTLKDATATLTDELHKFVDQHLGSGAPEPFRVPFESPKSVNPFRRSPGSDDVPTNTDAARVAGSLGFSEGKQFATGGYVPAQSGTIVQDALRAQKAANAASFVEEILDPKAGFVKPAPNGMLIEELVHDPSNFVLREVGNLRAAPKALTHEATAQIDEVATNTALKGLWKSSAYAADRVPLEGEFVLVPKPLDEAITRDLGKPVKPHMWANRFFKYQVLYMNPKWALGNMVGNIAQASLEGVGGLSYGRALKGSRVPFSEARIPGTDIRLPSMHIPGERIPLAPGVEEHGFIGSHVTGEAAAKGLNQRWADFKFEKNGRIKALKFAAIVPQVATDLVKDFAVGVENWTRRAAYSKISRGEAKTAARIVEEMHGITLDVEGMLKEMAAGGNAIPEARIAAQRTVERVNGVLGDYANMTTGGAVIEMAIPFARWFKFITGLTIRLGLVYPKSYATLTALGRIGQQVNQNLGGDLQDTGLQGAFPLPGQNDMSNALTLNVNHYNPFSTDADALSNLSQLTPLIDTFVNALTGQNVGLGGLPLLNQKGQNFAGIPGQAGDITHPASDSNASDVLRYIFGSVLSQNPVIRNTDQFIETILHGNHKRAADTSIPIISHQDRQPTKSDYAASVYPDNPTYKKPRGGVSEDVILQLLNGLLPLKVARKNLSGAEEKASVAKYTTLSSDASKNELNTRLRMAEAWAEAGKPGTLEQWVKDHTKKK